MESNIWIKPQNRIDAIGQRLKVVVVVEQRGRGLV